MNLPDKIAIESLADQIQNNLTLDEAVKAITYQLELAEQESDRLARIDELKHTDGLFECFKTTRMPVMKRIKELEDSLERIV